MYNDKKVLSYYFISTDLNNLKVVNDSYGHDVGDQLICTFASTLNEFLKDKESPGIVGRFGGDEFNILLTLWRYDEVVQLISKLNKHFMKTPIHNLKVKSLFLTVMVLLLILQKPQITTNLSNLQISACTVVRKQ